MKKLFVVLGVVAFGFCFTSCKKDCKCSITLDGTEVLAPTSVGEMSKSDCESYKYDMTAFGSSSKLTCKSE
jgi:hypothetical protein